MLDFLMISTRSTKRGVIEIYPKFIIKKSSDLMIRGGDFYAIWIENLRVWSTDEQDAIQLIDAELDNYAKENEDKFEDKVRVLHLWDSDSKMIDNWHKYCQKQMRDSYHMLDEKLIFSNDKVSKRDYSSKKLEYPLEPCEIPNYNHLMEVLYSPEERHKIEWAIGSVVNGDSKTLQKFMVLYGAAGTGKSTVLNIIQKLFDGYYSVFDAKALGSSSNSFALEAFKSNPLVAIQHDGDLSRIEDNTRLNSLVSHELMTVNEKFKATYTSKFKCFLFMGTNKPVKITDAKSGLLRRLIDVSPSGEKIPISEYRKIMKAIDFELGGIALHCKEVYETDPNRYDDYVPLSMMGASNDFYNYVLDSYFIFKKQDGVTLKQAWAMYKEYCDDAKVAYPLAQRAFKEELKNYFEEFQDRAYIDEERIRSYYTGFKTKIFEENNDVPKEQKKIKETLIEFKKQASKFDEVCKDLPAQYGNKDDIPTYKWDNVKTKLSDLDTSKLHYVKLPINHIVIDFDIPNEKGEKDFETNLKEASKWPATYAELSKSGAGIHLHYIYKGDPEKLSRIYDEHIEIKVFNGKSSLRRKLTKCNDLPIANISSGLPLKGEKKMVNFEAVKSEKALRTLIKRNLNKEIHPGTKPSIDFIYKILDDAYNSNLKYDVSDMRNAVLTFAANSTHQADYCVKLVSKMKFKSEEAADNIKNDDSDIVFYDVEVFPNLFLVNYKIQGVDKPVVRLINPTPQQIEEILNYRLIGFNCRRYDNHMLYARMMGYSNEQLFRLSQKIISPEPTGFFKEAYNISYTDVYDYCATKQSLKKWEIQLLNEADDPNNKLSKELIDILKRISHYELGLPWDQPVDEKLWTKVAEYCDNDVLATEATFMYTDGDFTARKILADIAGLSVNDTTNTLTTRIIFGKERNPQLVYTDLATGIQTSAGKTIKGKMSNAFPGYHREWVDIEGKDGKKKRQMLNMYMDTDVGFGGYVYARPGMYGRTVCFDVAGMHPTSAIELNAFGDYTKNFKDIVDARVAIKHGDYELAKTLFDGKLAKYLNDHSQAKQLAKALKIAVNSVYGLTSAKFDNPFKCKDNDNNIVALRGALFMRTLQEKVKEMGYTVVHIKTDSIKIANPDEKISNFIMDFGKKYGYSFEIEHVFDRICLVNDAVYIGLLAKDDPDAPGKWEATGTQFQVPYVYKTLFSKEPLIFADYCEVKSVSKGAIYLDMNEPLKPDEHDYHFVGRVGQFTPIKPGKGGGDLIRINGETHAAVSDSKDFKWLESNMVKSLKKEKDIDKNFYIEKVDKAIENISKYGDIEMFCDPNTEIVTIVSDELPEFKEKKEG